MFAITEFLFHLDRRWMIGASRFDDLPETSALGLIALLEAPALWIWHFLYIPRVSWILLPPGIGTSLCTLLFWFWVGLHLDRRRRGNFEPILRAVWLRAALYVLAIAVSLLFLYVSLRETVSLNGLAIRLLWEGMISNSPKRILLGREITDIAYMLWGTACVAYCVQNLWWDTWQWKRVRQETRSQAPGAVRPF
jgi:hypothetical protein